MSLCLLIVFSFGANAANAKKTSSLCHQLIEKINSLRAHNTYDSIPGYPVAEIEGYYHYTMEKYGHSKEGIQRLLRAGHKQKDRYNRKFNSVPGYPSSEMPNAKLTISDLLGDIYYPDQKLGELALKLGFNDKLFDENNELLLDVWYFFDEEILNLAKFRKAVEILEPEFDLNKFK